MKKENEVDFLGNEIRINDYIAFARNPYADLILGKIVGFTEKGLKVIRKNRKGEWDSKWFDRYDKEYEVILPYQCVKVKYNE